MFSFNYNGKIDQLLFKNNDFYHAFDKSIKIFDEKREG